MIGIVNQDTVIAFSDKDLPINGTNHNEALNITMDIGENWVPMVLIDNGSALNVCTLKTTICLGINHSEFLPSNQSVRAYDDTKRKVHGVVILNIFIVPMVQKSPFSRLVLEIHPVDGDLVLSGFDFEEVHTLVSTTKTPEFFPVYYAPYSNDKVVTMIRGMGYFPGMVLGRKDQGMAEFQDYPKAIPTFGLGYKPTEEDLLQKKERVLARIEAQNKDLMQCIEKIGIKDWAKEMDGVAMEELLDGTVHMLGGKTCKDPSLLIGPTKDPLTN
ncbi:serine/threonine-protein kinase ATM-like [Fagus crenata]